MKETYLEMVKADVKAWLSDNEYQIDLEEYAGDIEAFTEMVNEECWLDDSVTGNASGSYTFNSFEAMEIVTSHMPAVMTALTEFGYEASQICNYFVNEEWETIDVITRCYYLYEAINEVVEEENIEEELDKLEKELTAAELIDNEEEKGLASA